MYRILKPYLRGLPLILLTMIAAYLLVTKYLTYIVPTYESTTKIKLANPQSDLTGAKLFKDFDVFASQNKLGTEIEVLKSDLLINKALDKLDFDINVSRIGKLKQTELYEDCPFKVDLELHDSGLYNLAVKIKLSDSSHYELWIPMQGSKDMEYSKGLLGVPLEIKDKLTLTISRNEILFDQKPNIQWSGEYDIIKYNRIKLVHQVKKDLDVLSVDKDISIIKVIFRHVHPAKAAIFANTLANTYIEDYIDNKYQTASVTSDFLDKQIEQVYTKLNVSERKIQAYRDQQEIINLRQETETDLRKVSQLKIQQTNVRMSLEAIEQLHKYIQEGKDDFLNLAPNFEAFTDLLSTEMVKKIKELQQEKRELLIKYTPEQENVKAINDKISYYTSYFQESINNTKINLQVKYQRLSDDISRAEAAFNGLPEKEKILNILDREFNMHQQSYVFLNQKKIEAEIAKAAKIAFHRIIAEAQIPASPIAPNVIIITILVVLLSAFFAVLFIYLVHLIKAKVNDELNVQLHSDIPILLKTPKLKSRDVVPYFDRESTELEIHGIIKPKTIITISQVKQNEGAAFHAIRLANSFKAKGKKVILLDANQSLKQENTNALLVPLESNEFRSFSLKQIKAWIKAIRSEYDLTIIHNDLLAHGDMGAIWMNVADYNIVSLDCRLTPLKWVEKITAIKDHYNFKNCAFILNRSGFNPGIISSTWKCIVSIFKPKN